MRFGVVRFPGSNCEQDVVHAVNHLGFEAGYIWHADTSLDGYDAIVLPGGFSYGDYIRCGAVARFSPVMAEVVRFAEAGGPSSASATVSRSSPRRICFRAHSCGTGVSSSCASPRICASRRVRASGSTSRRGRS